MNKPSTATLTLLAALLLAPVPLPAQQAGQPDEPEAQPGTASREVEISEDNYRRFMELKDQPIERALPINTSAVQSQAGLEKMQRLPEASQKHLREQLRELIVESGPWTPASPQGEYPFVPSEAALGDSALRQQEAEAWEELVGQYHAREADIFAARQAGASGNTQSGAAGQPGSAGGSDGQSGQDGQPGAAAGGQGSGQSDAVAEAGETTAAQAARQSIQQQNATPQARVRYRPPDEGAEQSALEFLTGQRPAAGSQGAAEQGQMTLEELERVRGIGVISAPAESPAEQPRPEPEDEPD